MSGGRAVNIVQMLVQQVQYVSLLRTLPIGFPDKFRDMLSVLNFINIDPRLVIASNEIPLIDHRGMFVIVSIIWPLFLSLCVLVLYVKFSILVSFLLMVTGVGALGAGLLGRYLDGESIVSASGAESYIIGGGVLIAFGITAIVGIRLLDAKKAFDAGGNEAAEREELFYNQRFHRLRTFRHLLTTLFFFIAGLTLSGLLDYGVYKYLSQSSVPIWVYVGYALLVCGFFNFVYFALHLTEGGRQKFMKFQHFIQSYGLLVLLLLISTTYIPVITYALSLLMCATYSCPAGAKFNPYAMRAEGNYTRDQAVYCDMCLFRSSNCGAGNVTDLCPSFSGNRVWTNPEIPCDDAAAGFFRAAASMILGVYVVVIPLVIFFVIRFLSREVMAVRYDGVDDEPSFETQWARVLPHIRPQASSLYENFTYEHRYFGIYTLMQRLAVMVLLVMVAAFTEITVPVLLALYVLSFVYVARMKPYLFLLEQRLAMALAACNVLNASLAVYLWQKEGGQSVAVTAVFIVVNVGVPLILSVVMLYQQRKRTLAANGDGANNEEGGMAETQVPSVPVRVVGGGGGDGASRTARAASPASTARQQPPLSQSNEYSTRDAFEGAGGGSRNARRHTPKNPSNAFVLQEMQEMSVDQLEASYRGGGVSATTPSLAAGPVPTAAAVNPMARVNEQSSHTSPQRMAYLQKTILRSKQRSWDRSTGDKYLGGYFMVVVTFCVLALGACVVGSLRMQAPQFLVSTDRLYQRNSVMLAGYPTWDVMNENCCCLEGAHPSETFNIQERWVCRTNKVIERGRRTRNNEEDGRPVRGVCKSEPVDSQICTIPSTENGKPYMDCGTSDELFVPDLMSEYAYDFLF